MFQLNEDEILMVDGGGDGTTIGGAKQPTPSNGRARAGSCVLVSTYGSKSGQSNDSLAAMGNGGRMEDMAMAWGLLRLEA
ncbi:hypothetical protein GCM10007860_25750 [Chitiniphilus shinanonensis]|uniref:Uncharacterized protein n=1 Tax=Chitiniphilus shinanonensis TaxID=553088 RepID=A0ABQ6BYW1_9NEIS|nr:hypothetical protein GCM10007860_25750 [Chitiniphilus shinanonensis]